MEVDLMVVDDDDILREIIKRFMRDTEFSVCCFSSGVEAKKNLGLINTRVMLVDFNMPVMNGLEFLLIVSSMPEYAGTQAYLCSSVELTKDITEKALRMGVCPVNKKQIVEKRFLIQLCST
jgi:two-component system chemotaxis response regulator CheY